MNRRRVAFLASWTNVSEIFRSIQATDNFYNNKVLLKDLLFSSPQINFYSLLHLYLSTQLQVISLYFLLVGLGNWTLDFLICEIYKYKGEVFAFCEVNFWSKERHSIVSYDLGEHLHLCLVYNVCYAVRISRVADVVGGGGTERFRAFNSDQLQHLLSKRLLTGLNSTLGTAVPTKKQRSDSPHSNHLKILRQSLPEPYSRHRHLTHQNADALGRPWDAVRRGGPSYFLWKQKHWRVSFIWEHGIFDNVQQSFIVIHCLSYWSF